MVTFSLISLKRKKYLEKNLAVIIFALKALEDYLGDYLVYIYIVMVYIFYRGQIIIKKAFLNLFRSFKRNNVLL